MNSKRTRLLMLMCLIIICFLALHIYVKLPEYDPFDSLLDYTNTPIDVKYWHKGADSRPSVKNMDYDQVIYAFEKTDMKNIVSIDIKGIERFIFNYSYGEKLIQLVVYENNQVMLSIPDQDLPLRMFLVDLSDTLFKDLQAALIK